MLSANSALNNDNNNNSNHNNVSVITNNINSNAKLAVNAKSSLLEERPSPSGSSGSSDRASLANHNGYPGYAYKIHQMHNSVNMTSGQYPYQNVNPKMYSASSCVDPNQTSLSKLSKLSANILTNVANKSMICNQSVIQSPSVPSHAPHQTQSQSTITAVTTSAPSKVPPTTKPKPVVPPKPSVPVKPIPPPRQSPIHLYGAQTERTESLDINTLTNNTRNNSYGKKGTNLLTTGSAPINMSSSGYKRYALLFT